MFRIHGLRQHHKYDGTTIDILCGIEISTSKRVEISIKKDEIEINYENNGFTWISMHPLTISSLDDVHNYIKKDNLQIFFKETPRQLNKHPIWIFIGLPFLIKPITNFISLSIFDINDYFSGNIIEDIVFTGLEDYSHILIEDFTYISVNFEIYRESSSNTQSIYIFFGDSNKGKSFISHKTSLSVYETDQSKSLPDEFTSDIIVIGKKYQFSIDMIAEKIDENFNIISVKFSDTLL
jgi:hypothetical protein